MPNNRLYSLREFLKDGIFDETSSSFDKVESVYVPMIQRPYAQGRRADAETEIRKNFVNKIFRHLQSLKLERDGGESEKKAMELNFVYGSFTDKRFELLDGQQRLTTLFLLSWYVAMRSGCDLAEDDSLAKFTYQTRTTSTEFIKKLLSGRISITGRPSSIIKAQPWYTSAFSKDSTVTGMLTMLDEIHSRYEDLPDEQKPASKDLDSIRFYIVKLANFGLTDELFVKMNARGLQLTPFENFKAELTGWIRKKPFGDARYEEATVTDSGKMPYWLYFSSRTDGEWTDIFWEMPEGDPDPDNLGAAEADRKFFTFIKRWLANRALAVSPDEEGVNYFRYFSAKASDNSYYSFDKMREFLEWSERNSNDVIKQLGKTLSLFSDSGLKDTILNALTPPWEKTTQMPWDVRMEMRPMIVFSAICEFILMQPEDPKMFDRKEFARWMRIVHNIVQNRDINGEGPQILLTRQLNAVLHWSNEPVYPRFADYVAGLGGRSNREFTAEKEKISLILENSSWEDAFRAAERNEFMTGAVTFYLDKNDGIEKYKDRTAKISLLFDSSGVKEEFRENNALLRGIMTRTYDYSSFKFPEWNLSLSNRNAADRFLKNLTVYNTNPQINLMFRELLDCKDTKEMKQKLEEVALETHTLLYPAQMDADARALLQRGYDVLHSLDPENPLGWLASLNENSMRIYYFADGRTGLYKGPVNCMYFNTDMEKFIPELDKELKAAVFKVRYSDERPLRAYEKFGLYSGSSVVMYIGENEEYAIWIGHDFRAMVYCTDFHRAAALSEKAHPRFERALSLDENGQRKKWDYEQKRFFQAFTVPDIRTTAPKTIVGILEGERNETSEPIMSEKG